MPHDPAPQPLPFAAAACLEPAAPAVAPLRCCWYQAACFPGLHAEAVPPPRYVPLLRGCCCPPPPLPPPHAAARPAGSPVRGADHLVAGHGRVRDLAHHIAVGEAHHQPAAEQGAARQGVQRWAARAARRKRHGSSCDTPAGHCTPWLSQLMSLSALLLFRCTTGQALQTTAPHAGDCARSSSCPPSCSLQSACCSSLLPGAAPSAPSWLPAAPTAPAASCCSAATAACSSHTRKRRREQASACKRPSPSRSAPVLGGVVLVLVLGGQPQAGAVVGLARAPPLVLHLQAEEQGSGSGSGSAAPAGGTHPQPPSQQRRHSAVAVPLLQPNRRCSFVCSRSGRRRRPPGVVLGRCMRPSAPRPRSIPLCCPCRAALRAARAAGRPPPRRAWPSPRTW